MTTSVTIEPAGHTVEVTETFDTGAVYVTTLNPGDPKMVAHIWDGKTIAVREVKVAD